MPEGPAGWGAAPKARLSPPRAGAPSRAGTLSGVRKQEFQRRGEERGARSGAAGPKPHEAPGPKKTGISPLPDPLTFRPVPPTPAELCT